MYRYRLVLKGDDLLEMFERFEVGSGEVLVTKYSFHWQDAAGALQKRRDNAPHHAEVSTFPHHVHDGSEEAVFPHEQFTAVEVLKIIR